MRRTGLRREEKTEHNIEIRHHHSDSVELWNSDNLGLDIEGVN
jgi:hypothetical protein